MIGRQAVTEPSLRISAQRDSVAARRTARKLARALGFSAADQAMIATAVTELARNIVTFAGSGTIEIAEVANGTRRGLRIIARDQGPGITDIPAAMSDGFSTGNSLGLGLPGTRRIVDEFDIRSAPGKGVTVTAVKWIRQ